MRLNNYLRKLAEKYPKIRVVATDKYLKILRKLIKEAKRRELELGCVDSTLRCILCKSRAPSLELISRLSQIDESIWEFTFSEIQKIRAERSNKPIKLVKMVTPELFYLFGAFRDGAITKHKYQVQICQKARDWIEKTVNPMMKKVFGIEFIYRGFKNGAYIFHISSKALYAFLDILANMTEKLQNTPQIVLQSPFELQRYYVGGFYDAEGDRSIKSGRIGIYQAWKNSKKCPPLEDIKTILSNEGIESSIQRMGKRTNSFLFRLYVFKRSFENITKFLNNIPLFHPDSLKLKNHFVAAQ